MRVPLSWLGEWVDLPENVSLESVHEALVKVGFEEEDVHTFDVTGPVVVGQVLEFTPEPQSNGKTINWCQVDVGALRDGPSGPSSGTDATANGRDIRGIVCGAHNFAVGDKVVVTLPGAVLPGPFPIAARKTYGHTSDGMIASARELGLGDEHDGILRLAALGLDDAPVGADAIHLLGLDDAAVEINVTPDRGYALSIRGVAREYSHSTGAAYRDPTLAVTPIEPVEIFPVKVDDKNPVRGRVGSEAFTTRVVRGIDPTRPTPPWMVARLKLAGVRSISLPVDITNYVMFELGQPVHGYDLAKLQGGLVVRRAAVLPDGTGEKLETLDGVVRTLSPEDLLITDGSGPIGLAGVMGGATTEISDATTDVLIEAANFDPISIARTARRHKLPSEASRRFERGVDPTLGPVAAQRVVELLVSLAGGAADPLGSVHDVHPAPAPIDFDPAKPTAVIGVEYSEAEVHDSLVMIGATVEPAGGDRWTVTPPPWRSDLTDPLTLVEEVARIVGYDRIPSVLPIAPPGRGLTRAQSSRRRAAATLAAAGATEVLAYPFSSAAMVSLFDPDAPAMKLANPLDPQFGLLRRSVLPGLIEIARRNLSRGMTDLALFEIATVFLPEPGAVYGTDFIPVGAARPDDAALDKLNASIPPQHWHVGALFLGDALAKQPGSAAVPTGLTDALDVVRQLSVALAVDIVVATGSHPALHPGRTASLTVATADGPRVVGVAGELLPSVAHELDLPRVVALVELDLDALIDLGVIQAAPHPIGTLPAATQDLSLVVPLETPAGEVLAAVVAGAGGILEDARLVDDYRGTGLPGGRKSLTFALRFRASDRTLTAAEASEAKLAGAARAAELFGATVRE